MQQYPPYLSQCLITIIKEYENYEKFNIKPPIPLYQRVSPENFMLLQRYWNEPHKTWPTGQWIKSPYA